MGQKIFREILSKKDQTNKKGQEMRKEFSYVQCVMLKLHNKLSVMAVNPAQSLLLATSREDNDLNIYGLFCNERKIKIIRKINGIGRMYFIKFLKKQNGFIALQNNYIVLWQQNDQNNWYKLQQLAHNHLITDLQINNEENLIISGTQYERIAIWEKNSSWEFAQLIELWGEFIYCLSLNQMENTLIVSTSKKILYVFQGGFQQKWEVIQKFQIEQEIYQLSFVLNNQFIVTPDSLGLLFIYSFYEESKEFRLRKFIKIQNKFKTLLPLNQQQKFDKKKMILLAKQGKYQTFYRLNDYLEIEHIFELEFTEIRILKELSSGGDYFVTSAMCQEKEDYKNYWVKVHKYRN